MKKNLITIIFLYFLGYLIVNFFYENNYYNLDYFYIFSKENYLISIFVFCFLFIFGMVMLLPVAMVLLLASGIIWGVAVGTVISTISTSIAASISFLIIRNFSNYKIFKTIKEKILSNSKIDIKIGNQIKYVILCTLNPLLPQGLLNYAFGLTNIKFKDFFIIISVVSAILNFFYVMLGASLKIIIIEGSLKTGIIYFGIAITFITLLYFIKDLKAKKK